MSGPYTQHLTHRENFKCGKSRAMSLMGSKQTLGKFHLNNPRGHIYQKLCPPVSLYGQAISFSQGECPLCHKAV